MKKIISLFQRNYDGDRLVRDEVTPGAEWVLAGEGTATRKFDGTCCMIRDGKLYRRHELKAGKVAPAGFEPAQDADIVTGDVPGWVPVGDGPEDRWHREAFEYGNRSFENGKFHLADGTYELVGPKIQGNPEKRERHELILHGHIGWTEGLPRDYAGLKEFLSENDVEGVVWHHEDGRMVKIKGRDFGIKRQKKEG